MIANTYISYSLNKKEHVIIVNFTLDLFYCCNYCVLDIFRTVGGTNNVSKAIGQCLSVGTQKMHINIFSRYRNYFIVIKRTPQSPEANPYVIKASRSNSQVRKVQIR